MFALARATSDNELEKWQAVLAELPTVETWGVRSQLPNPEPFLNHFVRPLAALAKAHLGDREGAEDRIGQTPADCFDCVRTRGTIASVFKEWGRADYWFARAVQEAPSIPFAHEDWGRSLLARGQPDRAIEQFTLSNQKGPHFADPLEGWGEALMAKNQSHLALAKFAEAEKYAPNWGRLHLKWGEALGYIGRKGEARAQYQQASTLDLTAADKAELVIQSPHA
jgi:tetratricopeptide (TPR) repeat protein